MVTRGLVLKSTGSFYRVRTENGIRDFSLGGRMRLEDSKHTSPVTVGDWVSISEEGFIVGVEKRKNYLIRKATNLSKQTHIVAANLDRICLIASLAFPRTSSGFIDRVLVTAEAYAIPAAIVVNKTDLLNDKLREQLDEWKSIYTSAGYDFYSISAATGEGVEQIRALIQGKITLFTGHSGVGKSTLINLLVPGLSIKTGDISDKFKKGKHTTTFAEMHPLDSGGYIVDTPGLKEFGLYDMEPSEIGDYFPEILAVKNRCKFNNCLHLNEPGCAVMEAVDVGEIPLARYQSYLNIIESQDE